MRNDRSKGPATTALISIFESGLVSLRLFHLTVEGWTDHLGWQPINRADQDEIRPTPSTLNPGPGSFVSRACGPGLWAERAERGEVITAWSCLCAG